MPEDFPKDPQKEKQVLLNLKAQAKCMKKKCQGHAHTFSEMVQYADDVIRYADGMYENLNPIWEMQQCITGYPPGHEVISSGQEILEFNRVVNDSLDQIQLYGHAGTTTMGSIVGTMESMYHATENVHMSLTPTLGISPVAKPPGQSVIPPPSRIQEDLDRLLKEIDPELPFRRRAGFETLAGGGHDRCRQAAHSMREIGTKILHTLAPKKDVREAPGFVPDNSSNTGITRTHRLRYIIQPTDERNLSVALQEVTIRRYVQIDDQIANIEKHYSSTQRKVQGLAHSFSDPDVIRTRLVLEKFQMILCHVLRTWEIMHSS